ncbi:PREDICTED: zinc finger CCCH domain-containing protein 19-like, partial [Camelina sativa]|uniref:Zinc finger CCCH domain-containing protein 19-like n=1 Tax=Camelina sativa TaxID=90675 RepID=A0ABM1RIG4_CAMSA
EEKLDGAAVSEIETKPQEVDDVATVVSEKTAVPVDISSAVVTQSIKDDVKEDAENDSEAGKSLDIH